MNVARLNLSHGTFTEHSKYINLIRKISLKLHIPVAVLVDLSGPKYRTGRLKEGKTILRKGSRLFLTSRNIEGDSGTISVNFPELVRDISIGNTILLDDGAMASAGNRKRL
jgi:pyruvate kinase